MFNRAALTCSLGCFGRQHFLLTTIFHCSFYSTFQHNFHCNMFHNLTSIAGTGFVFFACVLKKLSNERKEWGNLYHMAYFWTAYSHITRSKTLTRSSGYFIHCIYKNIDNCSIKELKCFNMFTFVLRKPSLTSFYRLTGKIARWHLRRNTSPIFLSSSSVCFHSVSLPPSCS